MMLVSRKIIPLHHSFLADLKSFSEFKSSSIAMAEIKRFVKWLVTMLEEAEDKLEKHWPIFDPMRIVFVKRLWMTGSLI